MMNKFGKELEEFLEFVKSLNSLDYAKKVLFSHELKANNLVEGYSDDLESIERGVMHV